jgi:hypothetical protein
MLIFDSKSLNCVADARIDYFNDPIASLCDTCPLECDQSSYTLSISSARYALVFLI